GARAHGGSTITQQVTRSLLLSRKKVYSRKIKEAILSYRIDSVMNKDDILYIYLNQIYLGEKAFGVEAAARTYFDRGVKDLSLGQIALLAFYSD
ncbi:transglycosylase domain-containing protein, partial [Thermodesulfobacteriota bacterium]